MANTYTLLETITVGAAGAASVTFNSIPQTGYTDLVVKMSVRTAYAGLNEFILVYPNGSGSNGTRRALYGTGSAAGSESAANIRIDYFSGNTATANTFGSGEIYIPNYTSSNYKSFSLDGVAEGNTAGMYMAMTAGLWSVTTAISSLQFVPGNANFSQYSTFSLYGVSALGVTPTKAPKATGGSIIQTDGTYWYHAFLSSGTFTPATALSCDVLVVAGGGGGGQDTNGDQGGGGAGGVLAFASQSVGASAQTITVGAGGAAGSASAGSAGSNSQFASLTASIGGGYGGGGSAGGVGGNGGNGGGGSGRGNVTGTNPAGGTGSQGYNGGAGYGSSAGAASQAGGGGAGAGAAGTAGSITGAGAGGAGVNTVTNWGALSTALTTLGLGVSGYIAGGGTGTNNVGGGGGAGSGGGGAANTAGTPNTGSGGGGSAGSSAAAGAGGSGLVIIRYLAA